jgi:Hemerythrin HHE cation binding domain
MLARDVRIGTGCATRGTGYSGRMQLREYAVNPASSWNGKLTVVDALLLGHDEARGDFVRASMQGGRIAKAGERLAQLCLPHFEHEEGIVFPVLALLPDLERGNLRRKMMELMPLISDFRAMQDAMHGHQEAMASAIEEFLQAAHREKSREFADFAHNLRAHERIEDEVIYPRVILIGNHLQEILAI